jgi:hypothetical protein
MTNVRIQDEVEALSWAFFLTWLVFENGAPSISEVIAATLHSLRWSKLELELLILRIWKPQSGQQEAASACNVSYKEELEEEDLVVAKEGVADEVREEQEKN